MGVRFEWSDTEHIVMYMFIEHPWTWTEYKATVEQINAEMQGLTHPLATVVDVSQMKGIPKSGSVMQNLQWADQMLPDNVFGSVIVGAPPIIVTFMNILTQLRPKAKRLLMFANTLQRAHEMLAKRHDELFPELREVNKFSVTHH